MDSIIKKLSEIEVAASAIVAHAESQKEDLDKEYHELTIQFDEELERQTQAQIQSIRNELEQDRAQLLTNQTGWGSDSIEALKKEYEEKHTIYAQNILAQITKV